MTIDTNQMTGLAICIARLIAREFPNADLNTRLFALIGAMGAELMYEATSEDEARDRLTWILMKLQQPRMVDMLMNAGRSAWAAVGEEDAN